MRASFARNLGVAATAIALTIFASSAYAQRGRGGGGGFRGGGGDGMRGGDGARVSGDGWFGDRGNWSGGYGRGWNGGGWDHGYTSYYGRGWGYRPGFGWGIGLGDWYAGYYPYYGRWGGGGYGWGGVGDGNYGYWGPEYDTYSYGSSESMPDTYTSEAENTANESSEQGKLPPMPTEKELSGFTNQQLQSFISWVARGFTKELGQFSSGDTWVKYFKLDNLRSIAPQPPGGQQPGGQQMVAAQEQQPISQQHEDIIRDVLNRIDTVQRDSQYQTVTNTWGFKALQVALQEASRPPEERAAGVLRGQTEMLNKALDRVSTGESWRRHLEIGSLQNIANEKDPGRDQNLDKIVQKFDQVAQNPEYQAIVQLPGFEGVYGTLRSLTEDRGPAASAKREPPPPAETEVR